MAGLGLGRTGLKPLAEYPRAIITGQVRIRGSSMRKTVLSAAAAVSALALAAPAAAGEIIAGVYAHDVTFLGEAVGLGAAGKEGGANVHLGWRSDRLDGWPEWMRGPRAHVFISGNTEGDTSYIAAGLSWHIPMTDDQRLYLQPGMGLAVHDGYDLFPDFAEPGITPEEFDRRVALRSERIEFGSQILFEPEIALGYRITDNTSVELSYVHLSNGQIFHQGKNEGLDEVGIRFVHRFGN